MMEHNLKKIQRQIDAAKAAAAPGTRLAEVLDLRREHCLDEGVLLLTGHKTPDPISAIYAERGLAVRTAAVQDAYLLLGFHVPGLGAILTLAIVFGTGSTR